MSTVDSNDKIKENDKAFNEKKQQNDKQFVELCYKELYAAITMHNNVMQCIEKVRKQALDENKKLLEQEKEQASLRENIQNYNEALNKLITKETTRDFPPDIIDRIKSLLSSIIKQIEELKIYIKELDQKIAEVTDELAKENKALADEMKKIFKPDNPLISIRIPPNLQHMNHDKNDIKKLYLDAGIELADQVADGRVKASEMIPQGQKIADEKLMNYYKQKNPSLTQSDAGNIHDFAGQMGMQIARDVAKSPAAIVRVENILHLEITKEKFIEEKSNAEMMLNKFESSFAKLSQNFSISDTLTTAKASEFLLGHESAFADLVRSKDHTTEAVIAALDKTDECASKIADIKEHTRESLSDDDASKKISDGLTQIQQTVTQHQEALASGFDFLDDIPSPSQPSPTPSPLMHN